MGACREFCVGFSKCIIIFLNVVVLICAVSLIVSAAVYKSQSIGLDVKGVSSFAIAVGVFIAVIALFGCCGAIQENSCMLTAYAGILLTFFIIQVVLAILAFAAAGDGHDIRKGIFDHLEDLYNSSKPNNLKTIDGLQISLHCCGLYGPNGTEVQVPTGVKSSCCGIDVTVCKEEEAYKIGCVTELTALFVGSLYATGIASIIFALIELVCAVFAFCVRGNIRRQSELLA